MGHTFASELSASVQTKELRLTVALETHLRYNHFPPVPLSMVEPCMRAIRYAKRGDYSHKIRLPKGVTWHGYKMAPVSAVINSHHLSGFVDD